MWHSLWLCSRRLWRRIWAIPWVLALVGLAIPMIGSGFTGWQFVVGWLVLLILLWWIQPLGGADRTTRIGAGIAAGFGLVPLGTLGGFYLVPAVIAWTALVLRDSDSEHRSGS